MTHNSTFVISGKSLSNLIAVSPNKTNLTYKRRHGIAKFTLAATMKGSGNQRLKRRTVYLQTSKNGRTSWKSTYKLKTGSSGKVSKRFGVKKRQTLYYRWYLPARSRVNPKTYSQPMKVTVR